MQVAGRIGREYASQLLGFAVSIADRLLVPGLFLRTLGVASFSAWSVVIAASSLITVLDFGTIRYFTNRLVHLVESGDMDEAAHEFSRGMMLLGGVAIIAPLAVIVWATFGGLSTGDPTMDTRLPDILIPVAIALGFRAFASLHLALYRAHRAFAFETMALTTTDAIRIAVMLGALSLGFDVVAVAQIWSVTTILLTLPIMANSMTRYPAFKLRFKVMRRGALVRLLSVTPGLWLTMVLMSAYTALPTIMLGHVAAAAAIAQFILLRTLANFARQVINMFSNVFALELARRQAAGDRAGFIKVYCESSNLLSAQIAVGCGALAVLGERLFGVWTGRPPLFDAPMLMLGLLPLLFIPSGMLVVEALTYANRPWPVVRARGIQVAVTLATFFALPLQPVQLRMTAALAVGEILGLGVPLVYAIRVVEPALGLRLHAAMILRGLLVTAAVAAAVYPITLLPLTGPWVGLGIALAWAGLIGIGALAFLGLDRERRHQFVAAARARLGFGRA